MIDLELALFISIFLMLYDKINKPMWSVGDLFCILQSVFSTA